MSDSFKLFWNTAAQLVSKAITVITSVLILAYLSRYLGPAGIGEYSTIFAYTGIALVFVDLGFFIVTVRKIAQEPKRASDFISNLFILKFSLWLAVFGLAVILAWLLPGLRILLPSILVASLAQLLASLSLIPLAYLQAKLLMPLASLSDVAARLVNLAAVLWVIHRGLGLPWVMGAIVAGNLTAFLLNVFWTRRIIISLKPRLAVWRELLREAVPIGIIMILAVIYFRIDALILYAMKGSTQAGYYGAPYKVLEVLLAFPSIFGSSVFALMSRYFKESMEKVKNLFARYFDVNALVAMPIAFGVLAVAPQVTALVNGPAFAPSVVALRILVFAMVGSYLNSVMIYTLLAAGKQRQMIGPYFLAMIFNIVANLIVIPRFSFLGASVTTVATELLVLAYTGFLVKREFAFNADLKVLFKAAAASLFMLFFLWSLPSLHLIWLVLIGGALYAVLVWSMHAIDPKLIQLALRPRSLK